MARPKLVRLANLLVARGLAVDRIQADDLIERGQVMVDGIVGTQLERRVRTDQAIRVVELEHTWVGRGAFKLLGALQDLPMEVGGRVVADLGSSTGGFTDVLLEHGAEHVLAIDVGVNLLHNRLRRDPRVSVLEGTNVRTLTALPRPVSRMVGDLSFISLRLILPVLRPLLPSDGEALLMVKPQFEARAKDVLPGGTLRPEDRKTAIDAIRQAARDAHFEIRGSHDSRLPGARSGNVEHFLWLAAV